MSCGQPAQLPDALLELWLRKRALSSLHVRRQERPDFAVSPPPPTLQPLPTPPARSSKFATSFPPSLSPRWEASIHFTPLGRESCALASNKRGTAACVRGSLGAKPSDPGWGPGKGWTAGLQESLAPPRLPHLPALLPPLQWETEQGHPGPPPLLFLTVGGTGRSAAAEMGRCCLASPLPPVKPDPQCRQPVPSPARSGFAPASPLPWIRQGESRPKGRHLPLLQQTAVALPSECDPFCRGGGGSPLSRCGFGGCSIPAAGSFPHGTVPLPTTASQQDPNTTESSSSRRPPSPLPPAGPKDEGSESHHGAAGCRPSLSPAPGDSRSVKAFCFDVGKSRARRRRLPTMTTRLSNEPCYLIRQQQPQSTGTWRCPDLHVASRRETLTCHSFGSACELGTGALRQDFLGFIIFQGFLLLRRPGAGSGAGGRRGLCRGCRWRLPRRRARGLAHLCKRNGAGAEHPGLHPAAGRAPHSPKPTATRSTSPAAANGTGWCFGTLISGMSQIQPPLILLQPRVHSWGKSWSTVRDLGLPGMVTGAASPCCNASGLAAPSQKPSQGPTFLL